MRRARQRAERSASPAELATAIERLAELEREIAALRAAVVRQSGSGPAVRQRRSGSPAARPAVVAIPPLARDVQSGPPPESTSYPGVSLSTTTTSAIAADTGVVVVASGTVANESVWTDARVLEAVASRPGLDMRLLRGRVSDWLSRKPHCRLTVSTVLSFIERWRPSIDEAPRRSFGGRGGAGATVDDAPSSLAWIPEAEAACVAEQDRILAAAGIV